MQSNTHGLYAPASAFHACAGKAMLPEGCCDDVSVSVSRASSQSLFGGYSEQSCDSDYFSTYKAEALEQEVSRALAGNCADGRTGVRLSCARETRPAARRAARAPYWAFDALAHLPSALAR